MAAWKSTKSNTPLHQVAALHTEGYGIHRIVQYSKSILSLNRALYDIAEGLLCSLDPSVVLYPCDLHIIKSRKAQQGTPGNA
jgi:hypothetical protein